MIRRLLFVLLAFSVSFAAYADGYTKPKVRAITAFVRLDRTSYGEQIAAALQVLREAQGDFQKQGYEVQTIRIVTQPLPELVDTLSETQALAFLKNLDDASAKENFVPNVGPVMSRDTDDPRNVRLMEKALSTLPHLATSTIIAGEDGIHWKVIEESAALVHYVTGHSTNSQGNFNFTATAMVKPYGPFYPGTYHTGPGKNLAIGFEGANIVQEVFAHTHGNFQASVAELTQQLTIHSKVAESIGERVAAAHGWTFMGVDPTPAPLGDVSIGAAIETYTGAKFGSSGTLTAALAITTAVKAVPVKQIGYSGLMVPVLEDKRLAQRWAEGSFNTDDLLAYSAVCGTGLDAVPFPGDISVAQMARIMGDVASLAWKWKKPLSARLQPVQGKKAGEQTPFTSQYLFNTTLRAVP
ncbi:MAG TPA: DUF711 family protein [Steroidobacteraceae bacterium]|nr:DUF711 family protein [Steroidobacteraceae bacterium]